MNIHQYIDSTYLKTSDQAGISEEHTIEKIDRLVEDAIANKFKAVMIRPKYVKRAKEKIMQNSSEVLVGTVIGFHEGDHSLDHKLAEATNAISNGADEIDVVINYHAYLNGEIDRVRAEFIELTKLSIAHKKTIKWIIEVAALTNEQIEHICELIKKMASDNFDKNHFKQIFVKSSTGFYKTYGNKPNGATPGTIKLMLKNASPLPIKAAGGIRSYQDAIKMINLGVLRIGTSSAIQIANQE